MSVPAAPRVVGKPRRDEVSPIPHPLGYQPTSSPTFDNPDGMDGDVEVAGILFLSAASDQYPYQRQLPKVTKDQFDTSDNPGDNSLSDWWMRTQTDFSGGAGQEFMEPIKDDGVERRFWQSAGVDVFTRPGFVQLLPKAVAIGTPLPAAGQIARYAGGFIVAGGTEVRSYSDANPPVLLHTQTAAGPIRKVTIAGGFALLSMDGKVATMPTDGSAAPTDRYTGAGAAVPVTAYLKNRTLVMAGDKVWEVPGSPDQALDMATAAPKVNLHDSSWTWVGAASTPTSILLAGNGASGSSILSWAVDPQSGALPDMGAPTTVAELPPNERIFSIATYLGAYVVIATSAGVRVGTLGGNGGLTYGPLLGSPVMSGGDISLWDRFAQYPTADAGDGRGGLVRIDLSEIGQDGRAPWSTFTRIPEKRWVVDGIVTGTLNTAMVDDTGQLWWAHDGGPYDTGWLETSKVRYGTLELKSFSSVKVLAAPPTNGRIVIYTLIDGQLGPRIGELTQDTGQEKSFPTGNRRALAQMALRFEFFPDATNDHLGPVLEAWSMRSMPSIMDNGERVLLPLLNFDFERAVTGVPYGTEGWAWERWEALASRISGGGDIAVKEFNSGAVYTAVVEDCMFTQVAPPERASGFGGIITLKLRVVR